MSDDRNDKDRPTTAEVSVNWDGLVRFLGWQGTIPELKRVELDQPDVSRKRSSGG